MFTVTGKICVLGAVFMIGLVFVWLCHVCCRSIWRVILMRLESSARFSRILELSEINRERSRILPPSGAPVTHLAFLTTYVSSSHRPPTTVSTQFTRYNRNSRMRTRQGSAPASTIYANNSVIPESRGHSSLRMSRVSPATNTADNTTRDRMQMLVRQDAHVNPSHLENGFVAPMYLSIDSVGSELATDIDIRQSTTLTIASANSPPPSYHSTDSIMSQPTSLQSHRDRVMREFPPRQTSDSSETSIQSAPLNSSHFTPASRRERLQKISEQHVPSTSSPSIAAAPSYAGELSQESTSSAACQQIPSSIARNSSLPASDDFPPSYEELFGERT